MSSSASSSCTASTILAIFLASSTFPSPSGQASSSACSACPVSYLVTLYYTFLTYAKRGYREIEKMGRPCLYGCLGCISFSGCGNSVSTKTETVSKSDHPVALTLDANITALHMTNIVPKLSGKLVSTPLAVGQEVKAGDVVVQVDSAPYEQSVSQAESQLVAASSAATPTYKTVTVPAASSGGGGGGDNSGHRQELKAWYNMGALSKVEYNQMMADAGGSSGSSQGETTQPSRSRKRRLWTMKKSPSCSRLSRLPAIC